MSDRECEEEDDDEEEDDNDADEESKVQKKLHLFQCGSVQQSIKRIWDLLPKDQRGHLAMEGYVELNLRLQKALSQEFVLERAIDSAIGDWGEDVREGQQSMAGDEFAMFLFELCSLWCGPSVSLLVYLLFLNAVFIAITDARGAHTVGLRPLMTVERLPQPFFDLLSVQGWARLPEENAGFTADQALSAWLLRNVSPESEQSTRLQVQRQVFQVTHDVRSVLLFPDANPDGDDGILGLVKLASQNLSKLKPIEPQKLLAASSAGAPHKGAVTLPELHSRPWCSPTGKPPPPRSQPPNAQAPLRRALPAEPQPQRSRSQPGNKTSLGHLLAIGDGQPPRIDPSASMVAGNKPPPRGRAFDTRLAKNTVRGLVLAGQMTTGKIPGGQLSTELSSAQKGSTGSWNEHSLDVASFSSPAPAREDQKWSSTPSSPAPPLGASSPLAEQTSVGAATQAIEKEAVISQVQPRGPPLDPPASQPTMQNDTREPDWQGQEGHYVLQAPSAIDGCIIDTPWSAAYKLPRNPGDLYHRQVDALTRVGPQSVVYNAKKWQDSKPEVQQPFDRVLRKLPSDCRPSSEGPVCGPMLHPNEPIWFEMVHRLQGILKRQGRRADRRRKRRLRSKLFRGRSKNAIQKRDEGKELREYFDRARTERQQAPIDPVPSRENSGEFLNKVHEHFLLHRERASDQPFRIKGTGNHRAGYHSIGDVAPRKKQPVRPVYVPPPASSMSGRTW
jgi:hypothetical protein